MSGGLLNASGLPMIGADEVRAEHENIAAMSLEFEAMALKPGETLVIRPSVEISKEDADELMKAAVRAVPAGVGVLVIAQGTFVSYFDAVTTGKIIASAADMLKRGG